MNGVSNQQTQLVMADIELVCQAIKTHRNTEIGRSLRKGIVTKALEVQGDDWARQWYFQQYCFAVHDVSEGDISWKAVDLLLDAVNWSLVAERLTQTVHQTAVVL